MSLCVKLMTAIIGHIHRRQGFELRAWQAIAAVSEIAGETLDYPERVNYKWVRATT